MSITINHRSLLLVNGDGNSNNLMISPYIIMHNIHTLYIPTRCTGQAQPLDVGALSSAKASADKKRNDYMYYNGATSLTKIEQRLEWFYRSRHVLSATCIKISCQLILCVLFCILM